MVATTFGRMQQDKASMGHSIDRWLLLVVLAPALLKLFFLRADQLFEVHTMALEWLASGQFRHHYMGSWDHAFQFPVYTAIVAGIYSLGAGPPGVLVFQVVCGTLTAWLAHGTARQLLGGKPYAERVALGSALLTGLSPFLAYYQARMVHPFAWDMLLATALLRASIQAQPKRPTTVLGLFALAGLVLLNRPTLVVFLALFILRERAYLFSLGDIVRKAGLLILVLAPITLWLVRNHAVTGRFQLTSLDDQMRWMGMQEETEGSGYRADGRDYHTLLTRQELAHLAQLDPLGKAGFFRARWKAESAADPGLRLRMFLVKFKNFWWSRTGVGRTNATGAWVGPVFMAYATVMLVLILLAVVRGPRELRPVLLPVLLLSILQCSFYVETRHRLLAEPLLMMVALAAFADLAGSYRSRPAPLPT